MYHVLKHLYAVIDHCRDRAQPSALMEEDIQLAKLGYAGFDRCEAGFRICGCF
jgi:hypothetical protein